VAWSGRIANECKEVGPLPVLYVMARRNRWIPEKRTLVAITCRTLQGRFLFRPSPELNDIALGVFGRAQRLYPVDVCAVSVLSNHLHLLLIADDAQQVARGLPY